MAKILGRATIKVNGKLLDSNKGSTLDIGGVKRTSKMGNSGTHYFMEEPVPAKVELSVPHSADVNLREIHDAVEVTLNFEGDNGQTFVIPKAVSTEAPTTGDQDGDAKFVFEGMAAEQS